MDLSIIVPIYNVEQYVRTCIESIYQQGFDEDRFEVILVNDGTKDKSMEMIADIIQQHKNIVVINQENQGLSMARNNGMAIAKGEYILMPDSDDLLIENSVKPLLEKALETKTDMIVADFVEMNDEGIKNIVIFRFFKEIMAHLVEGYQAAEQESSPYILSSREICGFRGQFNKGA